MKDYKYYETMIKRNGTIFIPFDTPFADGSIISKDCEITFSPSFEVLESHRDEKGMTIITRFKIITK